MKFDYRWNRCELSQLINLSYQRELCVPMCDSTRPTDDILTRLQ